MNSASSPNVPIPVGLTMSSLEIAGLAGKQHQHVLRDIRKISQEVDTFVQNWTKVPSGNGRPSEICNLPKRETLILVSGYSTEMRARIIDRWLELEAIIAQPQSGTLQLTPEVRMAIGGIVKSVVQNQLAIILPTMAASYINENHLGMTDGLTAGEVCVMSRASDRFPRGIAGRVSRRLSAFCARNNERPRVSRLGNVRATMFPTHMAREWLDVEGKTLIRRWIDERKGQTVLKLVQS